jgi:calcium-dependent protein kinase
VKQLKKNYLIDGSTRILGLGQFGKVYACSNRHDTNFQVAIKVLDKQLMQYDLEQIVEEVKILNRLDHPNIVKYFETYNDSRYIYLVMELIQGK